MKRYLKILGLLLLVLAVLSVSVVTVLAKQKTIKIGFPAPLSGSSAGWGGSMLRGTQLAIEEINAAGGIHGYQLELIKGDVEGQEPSTVSSVVRKLITRDKVNIMVTGAANPSLVEYPLMQDSKMPYLLAAYSQTQERLFKVNPNKYTYVHNLTVSYEQYKHQWADIERQLEQEGKFKPINKRLAVVKSQNAYSIYCGDGLKETFKSRGWDVVIDETIPYGGRFTEFAPILAKIRRYKPAIILYTDHTSANAASFLMDFLQDPTPSLVYLQATPSYPDFRKLVQGKQAGVAWTYSDPLSGPKGPAFSAKFEKRWGKKPAPYGVTNYDIMMCAAKALRMAKNPFDRVEVNNILNASNFYYDGIAGKYEFNELHMAKTGPGRINLITKQEYLDTNGQIASHLLLRDGKIDTSDFSLPPWYEKGLRKYGK